MHGMAYRYLKQWNSLKKIYNHHNNKNSNCHYLLFFTDYYVVVFNTIVNLIIRKRTLLNCHLFEAFHLLRNNVVYL